MCVYRNIALHFLQFLFSLRRRDLCTNINLLRLVFNKRKKKVAEVYFTQSWREGEVGFEGRVRQSLMKQRPSKSQPHLKIQLRLSFL